MKIKTDNIEFVSFSDGVCNIYSVDDEGKRMANKYTNLSFSNRVLGFNRFFSAAANQMAITKIIRIPQLNNIDTYDLVEIGDVSYNIKLIQNIYESNPLSMDLTLQVI